ncbi:hypothetical protein R1flu_019545 [Riccia fluitans]|uniref:Uncharacterized protein n=1 Tax=Riccia fluitans TaxID=41844 RepID=A0ABD1ZJA4_9MARC
MPPAAQQKKKKPISQSGQEGGSSAQPPTKERHDQAQETLEEDRPDIRPHYTDEEPEATFRTLEEDRAVREVLNDPDVPCTVPREPSKDSMVRFSEQMVAMVKHWTMEKAASTSDAMTSVRPSVVTLAKFFLQIDRAGKWCTGRMGPGLTEKLVEQLHHANTRASGWQHLVAERDDELAKAKDELAKAKEDWQKQAKELEDKIYQVRDSVVAQEEESARWRRNDDRIKEFV